MKKSYLFLLALAAVFAFSNCDKDDDGCNHTYENGVKDIIDKSCSYAGCHAGPDASMWVPETSADYTNYEGMMFDLNSGEFESRALILRNMPDTMWTPDDRPQVLTEEEIEILNCWKDNGYPKD